METNQQQPEYRQLKAQKFLGGLALLLTLGFAGSAQALGVGDAAPCVVLNHLQPGGTEAEHCIRDPRIEGQFKIVEFFSAVCSDCARNRPIVHRLYQEIGGMTTFRFVGIDRSEKLLRDYASMHRNEIPFEVALDTSREAARAYGVVATPTLFVLNVDNVIVYKNQGVLTATDLAAIKRAVGARP